MPSRAHRRVLAIAVIAVIVLGLAAAAAEQLTGTQAAPAEEAPAYGTLETSSLAVWSYQFQGNNPFGDNIADDGYGYRTMTDPGDSMEFWAPIQLPSGIAIEKLELDNCDNQSGGKLILFLQDDFGDHQYTNVAQFDSTDATGCKRDFLTLPTPYHYPANLGHYLILYVNQSMVDPTLKFRGAVVTYRRMVSPAPATATFNDVPKNHPFFRFVEALVEAGITSGCGANPPIYCPDNPVTRAQMAVFLSVALGLHFPN